MRRWLLWLVWVAIMLVILTRFASLHELGAALARAHWRWVAAALLLHLACLVVYTLLYKVGFDLVGVSGTVGGLLPVFLASNVANAVAPAGGAAAVAVFIADARGRGQSGARTAVGMLVVLLADLATLIPFLAVGLWFLRANGVLKIYESLAVFCFVAFVAIMIVALVAARRGDRVLGALLGWVERSAGRVGRWFRRPRLMRPGWAVETARQFTAAAGALAAQPAKLTYALGVAVVLHLMMMAVLLFVFRAFDQPVGLGALIAGFGLGIVFYVVSVVPQGMAVVEGMMALVFTSLGCPGQKVAAIVLVFRGVNYWMPLAVGLPFVRRIAPARLTGIAES